MKTLILFCACLGASAADDKPTAGRVLLLVNERTLEGDIQRQGDQYSIRRTIGETWVPAGKVVALCANHEEAYRFLRASANLADPDERLRLARWCQKYSLREQAIEEVTHAVRLRPGHAESRRLLHHLQRPSAPETPEPPPPKEEVEPDTLPPPAVELSPESLSAFTTKVQPILMNACASCHATGRGGSFKLMRVLGTGAAGQRTVQHNLAAVVAHLNAEQPQASPLLVKAISAHGDAGQPPLKGRQVAAYHTLENWVRTTVARNPHVRDQVDKTVASTAAPEVKQDVRELERRTNDLATEGRPKTSAKAAVKPADAFDPEVFNRQMHPPAKPKDQ